MMPKSFYTNLKLVLITIISLPVAWAHWFVANRQLETLGFAARGRDANYFTYIVGYVLAMIAIANIIFAFKTKKFETSTIVLILLISSLGALFILST